MDNMTLHLCGKGLSSGKNPNKGYVRSAIHSSIFTDLNHGSSHKVVTYVYRAEDYELYILLYDCLKTIL